MLNLDMLSIKHIVISFYLRTLYSLNWRLHHQKISSIFSHLSDLIDSFSNMNGHRPLISSNSNLSLFAISSSVDSIYHLTTNFLFISICRFDINFSFHLYFKQIIRIRNIKKCLILAIDFSGKNWYFNVFSLFSSLYLVYTDIA